MKFDELHDNMPEPATGDLLIECIAEEFKGEPSSETAAEAATFLGITEDEYCADLIGNWWKVVAKWKYGYAEAMVNEAALRRTQTKAARAAIAETTEPEREEPNADHGSAEAGET